MEKRAKAAAYIYGSKKYPNIRGKAIFNDVPEGTVVSISVHGLPEFSRDNGKIIGPHGFHIHDGDSCELGTLENPFPRSGEHFNPTNQPHGNHAGDFPVLFSNNGTAHMDFFTNRIKPWQIIGKTLVIHEAPDDYRTEPSGDSGEKIACGVIRKFPE